MVLETLDTKKDDIFIFSENKFDLTNNFKLIKKNINPKFLLPIHFNDVCKYIEEDSPKSLIVYRLLTNLPSFELQYLKYGYVILINGKEEIIHFDPIFAMKELEEYALKENFFNLRFRIQQVGLISQLKVFGKNNFSEVYAFDLEAEEANLQNDKSFAEIIFAFDEINFVPEEINLKEIDIKLNETKKIISSPSIEEDSNYQQELIDNLTILNKENLRKENYVLNDSKKQIKSNQKFINVSNNNLSKRKTSFSEFLNKVKTEINSPTSSTNQENKNKGMIELFKNSSPIQTYFEERGKKQIILKYKNK
ncbi:MAG: hypothetical protein STSR0008_12930 [Ignavibacterium sp.]